MRKTIYGLTIGLAVVIASGAAIRAHTFSHHDLALVTGIDVSDVQRAIDIGSLPEHSLAPEVYQ